MIGVIIFTGKCDNIYENMNENIIVYLLQFFICRSFK